ncbi:MAG TPA: Dabb family protein [Desulfosarcina sp.]|nr:Dabb family protein [Desulfosarcina sp.]
MEPSTSGDAVLAHMVVFTLKDKSAAAVERLLDSGRELLTGHPGTRYFAIGTRVEDLTRPVNDQDYDVGLHVVFDNRESHDLYQTSPRHLQFIDENKDSWERVRVFDSYVTE